MTAGRTVNSISQDWGTPKNYVDAVRRFFGGEISLDPCSNQYSIVNARTEYRLPDHDGLVHSWDLPTIYVNPPYGTDRDKGTGIRDWLRKCLHASEHFGSEVLALVPVAVNTGHWKNYVWGGATAVCFLYDTRLRFLVDGKDQGKGAPMACAIIYWGKNYEAFFEEFLKFGAVVDLRALRDKRIGRWRKVLQSELTDEIVTLSARHVS